LNGSISSVSDDLSREDTFIHRCTSQTRSRLSTQVDVESILTEALLSSTLSFEGDVVTENNNNTLYYWSVRKVRRYNLALEGLANTTADFSAKEIALEAQIHLRFTNY
jgi:hypothetical protein